METVQPDKTKMKWYHTPVAVFAAILIVGPFAIPLVLASPAFKIWQKAVITLILIIATIWFTKVTIDLYQMLLSRLQSL